MGIIEHFAERTDVDWLKRNRNIPIIADQPEKLQIVNNNKNVKKTWKNDKCCNLFVVTRHQYSTSKSMDNYTLEVTTSSYGMQSEALTAGSDLNWAVLALSILIASTAIGNSLVCLAICKEAHLQTMTNYFLFSLAIADLLVAILVMPTGMYIELYGKQHHLHDCTSFHKEHY